MRTFGGYLLAFLSLFFLWGAFMGLSTHISGGHRSPEYGIFGFFVLLGLAFLWWGASAYVKWRRALGVWSIVFAFTTFYNSRIIASLAESKTGREADAYLSLSKVLLPAAVILLIFGVVLILVQRSRDRMVHAATNTSALDPKQTGEMKQGEQQEACSSVKDIDPQARGVCPNCGAEISMNSSECSHCKAQFGPGSAWKVKPLP